MENCMLILISIMILAGLMGGAINHFLSQENDPTGSTSRFIGRNLLVGLGASFMVPLFLNMLSSNLIEQIEGNSQTSAQPYKILVFAGFCLVASISSRAFIHTLSDRILNEVRETRREVEETKIEAQKAQENVEDIRENVEEIHADIEPILTKQIEDEPVKKEEGIILPNEIGETQRDILNAFANSKYALRTINGLSSDTGIETAELNTLLSELEAKNLLGKRIGKKGLRWYITQKGLDVIAGI